jgi:2-amino-4-hydroxy-6-hydroxymethyldihydropteridine diphosphokinase
LKSQKVILLMGGNQGHVPGYFRNCIDFFSASLGHVYAQSPIYSTKAWGPVAQPDFLNMAVGLYTSLPPLYLLREILSLEKRYGRKREVKLGPRTIDIDMLFYGQQVIRHPALTVPHPEILNRRFALVPCCDIAPGLIHPVVQLPLSRLLEDCKDILEVKPWTA